MKKRIALMTTAVMVVATIAVPAVFANQTDEAAGSTVDNPIVFDYQDIDESIYEGKWFDTELGFEVYLPADWEESEVTDEMAEAGLVFIAGENEETGGANLVITYTEVPEEVKESYDLEQLGLELAETNTTAMYADLNGIPAVIFENDETQVNGFAFLTSNGFVISGVISASPEIGYEEYGPYIMNMTMSISPTESDTEAESGSESESESE